NRSKIRGRRSGAIPTPVSRTRRTASCPSWATVTVTRPPAGVYFRALSKRFLSTCSSRVASTSTHAGTGHRDLVPARQPGLLQGGHTTTGHPPQLDRLPLEQDLPGRQTRDVEQVIDQAGQLTSLAADDDPNLVGLPVVPPDLLQEWRCIADRR